MFLTPSSQHKLSMKINKVFFLFFFFFPQHKFNKPCNAFGGVIACRSLSVHTNGLHLCRAFQQWYSYRYLEGDSGRRVMMSPSDLSLEITFLSCSVEAPQGGLMAAHSFRPDREYRLSIEWGYGTVDMASRSIEAGPNARLHAQTHRDHCQYPVPALI